MKLKRLLRDERDGVRLSAASLLLEIEPDQSSAVLEELSTVGEVIGFTADATLEEWRLGRLKYPRSTEEPPPAE